MVQHIQRICNSWSRLLGAAILAAACLTSLPGHASQDNIRFQHITLKQGLSQESVLAILQDKQGFMWFATEDGLNRYDGYSFKVFNHHESDPFSLSSDYVLALAEDLQGNLWVGTDGGGLNLYHPGNQSFTQFRYDPDNINSLSNNTIRAIFADSQGLLWIGTEQGLNSYNPANGQFTRYLHQNIDPHSISHDRILAIVEDAKGQLWIGTDGGGLNRFDRQNNRFHHYRHDPADPASIASDRIRSTLLDSQGRLWIGTYGNGASLKQPNSEQFQSFQHDPADPTSLANNWVRDIYEDHQGEIWLATDNGLDHWHNDQFSHHKHDPFNAFSLSSNKISALFQDSGRVFWVGSYNGLNKWNTATAAFRHIRHQPNSPNSLSNNGVNAFAQNADGKIWIGTYDGLNLWDPDNGRILQLHTDDSSPALSDVRVMSLHQDNNQQLWIGTRAGGLDKLNIADGSITNYRHQPEDPTSISANGITALQPAPRGQLWVATWGGGLNRLDPVTGEFVHYRHEPDNPTSISVDKILSVHADDSGLLWLGTWGGGLNILDPVSGQASRHFKQPAGKHGLNSNNIWVIYQDSRGHTWLGTQGGGLNLLTAASRAAGEFTFQHFTMRDGLPSNVIYGIQEDAQGYLWLSTNRGLAKFDPQSYRVLNYDSSHGLQGNEFSAGSSFKSQQGHLFFGGTNGATAFLPADIKPNPHQPPVVLTNFLKLNQEVSPRDSLHGEGKIELHYQDYLVAFEFAGLDFASPANNHYKYKLEGFDKQWIEAGPRRRATYTNLPDGRYTFRVKAANNDGVWNEKGIEIDINVTPPPWRTWWAYLSYALVIIAIIALFIRSNLRKLEQAARYRLELEQEVRNRTQELQNANSKLHEASVTDQLTGLNNRRYLSNIIDKEIAKVERELHNDDAQAPAADIGRLFFLMFDLDGFKPINDTYGHSAGDQVIIKVGELLKEVCRQSDILIRWGGDEFMVMGHVDNVAEVSALAERLRQRVERHQFDIGIDQKLHLSCSIGFAFHPFSTVSTGLLSWEQAAAIADLALYQSKERGRNCWTGIGATSKKPPVPLFHWLTQDLDKVIDQGYVKLIVAEPSSDNEMAEAN